MLHPQLHSLLRSAAAMLVLIATVVSAKPVSGSCPHSTSSAWRGGDVVISLGDATVANRSTFTIPLLLEAPFQNDSLPACSFLISIPDTVCPITFRRIETPAGTTWNGVPLTVTNMGSSILVRVAKTVPAVPGILANIVFMAGDVADTCNAQIGLSNWYFVKDDMNPILSSGTIRILPETPRMKWVSLTAPTEVRWDRTIHNYVPNPVTIHAVLRNAGDTTARNARFFLFYDSKYFTPLQPNGTAGTPADVDGYGGRTEADMKVSINRQSTAVDSASIWISATFDNHPDISSSICINIPRSEPVLDCSISVPDLAIGQSGHQYLPIPLRLTIRNTGVITASKVHADIALPAGMHLAGGTADSGTGKSFSYISAGKSASAVWTLQRDPVSVNTIDTVSARVWIDDIDTARTYAALVIPGIDAPSINAQCTAPSELTYDESGDMYLPDPITVTLQCSNTGTMPARNMSARLTLPPDMQLADSSDSLRRVFVPTPLDPGASTQPVAWPVRYKGGHSTDVSRTFKCTVTWTAGTGGDTISTNAYCTIGIPPGRPSLTCRLELPDTCHVNQVGTDIEPNPILLHAVVLNNSQRYVKVAKIKVIAPDIPGTSISLYGSEITVDRIVAPGDSIMDHRDAGINKTLYQRTIPFEMFVLDDSNKIISYAKSSTVVEGLSNPLVCGTEYQINYCRLSSYYDRYDSVVYVDATFTNISQSPLSNVEITAVLDDPHGLFVIDSTYLHDTAGNGWTRRAAALDSGTVRYYWRFILKKPSPLNRPDTVAISFKSKSDQSPLVESDCRQLIIVDPIALRDEHAVLLCPDTIRSTAGHTGLVPDSFPIVYKAWNAGTTPYTISKVQLAWSDNSLLCKTGNGNYYSSYSSELNVQLQPGDTVTTTLDMSISNVFTRSIPISTITTIKDVEQKSVVLDTLYIAGLQKPSITALDGTVACYWDSLMLDAGDGFVAYNWNSGETTRFIEAHHEGNHTVMVTAPDMSTSSASIWLQFHPMMLTPSIYRNKNTLSVQGGYSSYQWEYAGWPIPGAVSPSLAVTRTGVYGITVTDSNGCSASSKPVVIDMLVGTDPIPSVPAGNMVRFAIWPEPNRGDLHISLDCDLPVDIAIRITDLLGRTVASTSSNGSVSRFSEHLSLGTTPPGVYFVSVTAGDQHLARKIVRYK